MIAKIFPQQNTIAAKDQLEYKALPGFHGTIEGNSMGGIEFIACYELTDAELEELIKTRKIWARFLTYGGRLQPHLLAVSNPFE